MQKTRLVLLGSLLPILLLPVAMGCGAGDDNARQPPPDGGPGGPDVGNGGDGAGGEAASPDGAPAGVLPGPSKGSAIALSPDDSIAVVVNRDVGSTTIVSLSYAGGASVPTGTTKEVSLGAGSEPWQAVIGPDNDTAYVVLRRDQKLVKLGNLHAAPAVVGSVAVGSEPTGVALSPTGTKAYVANWVDGTVMGIDTGPMTVGATVDLNQALVGSGLLGGIQSRAALAHPRSIAVTNNGDTNDADESLYVTEYFAQRTQPEAADGSNSDTSKEGVVYKIKVSDKSVSVVTLAPLADMGFKDHGGGAAGCYPNQLQSIAISGGFAYVASICASPKGPVGVFLGPTGGACTVNADCGANGGVCTSNVCAPNPSDVKTTTSSAVSVIDLSSDTEVVAGTASLHAAFTNMYATAGTPDDGTRRLPLVPADIAFVPGSGVSYVAGNGADAVFRIQYDGSGKIVQIGASTNPFIDLNPAGIATTSAGKNPIGITVSNTGKKFMLVANDVSRNLTVVDINTQAVAGGPSSPNVVVSAAPPAAGSPEASVLNGKRLFNTGTGRWSLKGQGWGACQSCHTDGLTDNVTWYFARGPRQSTSLDGSFSSKNPADQRILNWTAINDETADFELNTRGISGGVGAIVSAVSTPPALADRIDIQKLGHAALSGSAAEAADPSNPASLPLPSKLTNWADILAYVQSIRSPRAPTSLDAAKVATGHQLFTTDGACIGCHSGDKWTISSRFYSPSATVNAGLAAKSWTPPSSFPVALLPASTPANRFVRFSGAGPAGSLATDFDQMQCILRPVGTYGVADTLAGIAELRANMKTPGQGNETDGKGYNPPSLLALSVGAPLLHAGNATTLESLFSPTFATHFAALAPNFLSDSDPSARATKVDALVAYLLSIDESTTSENIPQVGANGGNFCSQ